MSEFKQYQRTQIAEMRPVNQNDINRFKMHGYLQCGTLVSISEADLKNGSPRWGDMIARNPKNHKDKWLVAEQYFKDNFEAIKTINDE